MHEQDITVVENKFIIIDKKVSPAFEEKTSDGTVNLLFMFKMLTCKQFRSSIADCIHYALRHADSYRGTGSSDVIAARAIFDFTKLFKE